MGGTKLRSRLNFITLSRNKDRLTLRAFIDTDSPLHSSRLKRLFRKLSVEIPTPHSTREWFKGRRRHRLTEWLSHWPNFNLIETMSSLFKSDLINQDLSRTRGQCAIRDFGGALRALIRTWERLIFSLDAEQESIK